MSNTYSSSYGSLVPIFRFLKMQQTGWVKAAFSLRRKPKNLKEYYIKKMHIPEGILNPTTLCGYGLKMLILTVGVSLYVHFLYVLKSFS